MLMRCNNKEDDHEGLTTYVHTTPTHIYADMNTDVDYEIN